jgi:thioredoxin reductase (NADPH)
LRDNKTVILWDRDIVGGQVLNTPKIANIPGLEPLSGLEFADKLLEQVQAAKGESGVFELKDTCGVDNISRFEDKFIVCDEYDQVYMCRKIIAATGANPRRLGVPGEEELIGRNISFCSLCDGPFYKDKLVVVVGGGNSALTEALELAETAQKVTILQNLSSLTGESVLVDQILNNPKIEVKYNVKIDKFKEGDRGEVFIFFTDEEGIKVMMADGIFIAIGLQPDPHYLKELARINENGYITEFNCKGVYVAGDLNKDTLKQVVIACGDGATAAIKCCRELNEEKTNGSKDAGISQ